MTNAHDAVAAYWAAAEARDWDAFGALLADDVLYRGPQTREQVRGRDAYLRFNVEGFAYDWHITVQRIVGEDQHAASWVEFDGPQGPQPRPVLFRARRRRPDRPHHRFLARPLRSPRYPRSPGGTLLSESVITDPVISC